MSKTKLILSREEEGTLIDGLNFMRGYLDMIYNSCLALDGLENLDSEGLMSITGDARMKLNAVKDVFDRLNAGEGN
ncbi:MAG: hypothetical protein CVU61_09495 [Deltaproteobacteria bacterium HGW-Deltaproteobacteria-19]|jgi:hypothetical protein|nr:MAG: hypothetical protein CVU61_09495 [Deltaproteobacteria bacterium HGW-Deltaproteobacteria-19]